jgi:hypothetical protein
LALLLRNGDGMPVWFGWNRNGVGPYSLSLGTKYLTHVGNLEAQETTVVDESSYSTLFKICKVTNTIVYYYFSYFNFRFFWMV